MTLRYEVAVTPLDVLQLRHPSDPTTLVLLEQSLDAEKTSFLVETRRLVMATTRTTPPSFLQDQMAHGLPLPRVALASVTDDQNNREDEAATRKFRTMLA